MAAYYDKGRYRIRIQGQSLGENKKTNPEVQLVVRPIGQYMESGEIHSIATDFDRTIYLVLTPDTIGTETEPGWVLATLNYLGFRATTFAALDPESPDHHSFIGVECDALCEHDTYQGKEREKWSILRPRTRGPVKPLEKKGVRALDARFGKVLKALAKSDPSPEASPRASGFRAQAETKADTDFAPDPLPAGRPDEDIPF